MPHRDFTAQHFMEYKLGINLRPKVPDEISWKLSVDGEYSANSTY